MGDSRQLNSIAARQRGVFNTSQARSAGFNRSAVSRRISNGEWIRLDHSVMAMAASAPSWERRLTAAVLSRPKAVVAHVSAAHLLGMREFGKGRPVILVPQSSNPRSDIARIIESDQFDAIATTRVDGFEVTTMPETLLSLAADLGPVELEMTFDEALLSAKLDLDAMMAILDREAGRRTRGVRAVRRLTHSRLPSAATQPATYLERLLVKVLVLASAEGWVREYPMSLGGHAVRVDLYMPSAGVVIEADGRNWHMRWHDFETDRRRDNALAAAGLQVLRYTYRMLEGESDRCATEIAEVVTLRGRPLVEPAPRRAYRYPMQARQ